MHDRSQVRLLVAGIVAAIAAALEVLESEGVLCRAQERLDIDHRPCVMARIAPEPHGAEREDG